MPRPNSAVCTQSHVSAPQSRLRPARSQSVAWQGSYGSGVCPSMVSFLRNGMDLNSKTYPRIKRTAFENGKRREILDKNIITQPFKVWRVL